MKKVLQIRRKGKVRKGKAVEVKDLQTCGAMNLDSKMALIHELIPIGLNIVKEPGAYIHNFRYAAQLLQDSYQALSGVSPPGVRPSSSDDRAATIYTYP